MRRDVIVLPPMGNIVIRFVADNPGVALFHCELCKNIPRSRNMLTVPL